MLKLNNMMSLMKIFVSCPVFLFASVVCLEAVEASTVNSEFLSKYNVEWTSPSKNSMGSMPIGNGDIGANVWVEDNGDLLFYLSKTDAWSENCRLLKLGRVRVALTPNPLLEDGSKFSQRLDIEKGEIIIRSSASGEETVIRFLIDANNPVVMIDVDSSQEITAKVSLELWRKERRQLTGSEMASAYGCIGKPFVEPDVIHENQKGKIIWYHRNVRSIWEENMKLQALGELAKRQKDPLLNLTFGARIEGSGLVNRSDSVLESSQPSKRINIAIYPLTAQTDTINTWGEQLDAGVKKIKSLSAGERLTLHRHWWQAYHERSYIEISTKDKKDLEVVDQINQGYLLQRMINAFSGRGRHPIKFNGSIFNTDHIMPGKPLQNADYRAWGGPYWFQNTRLCYWHMLNSGDYDLMKPFFELFRANIETRKYATRKYYNHDGAFFPETQYFWGTYNAGNYGVNRSGKADGYTDNTFIRYYWQGGLELSLMMLDYYSFTGDEDFMRNTLLEVVPEVLTFFDQHWERDANGKIRFDPAMALETYKKAVNPLVEIVAIEKVCNELLSLPNQFVSDELAKQCKRLISELPPVPTKEVNGELFLSPAEEYSGAQNTENPELYSVFPYRRYSILKPDIKLAIRSFDARRIKATGCWRQNVIKAATLGLTDVSKEMIEHNFATKPSGHRFPAFWPAGFDWAPDQDHGGVSMIALQKMLLQYDEEDITLLPAWPKGWDVNFKLHAPSQTIVEAQVRSGEIRQLKVSPERRKKDIRMPLKMADGDADVIFTKETYAKIIVPENGTVYYTTDGSEPDARSAKYTAPVEIDKTCIFKAIAIMKNQGKSLVLVRNYADRANAAESGKISFGVGETDTGALFGSRGKNMFFGWSKAPLQVRKRGKIDDRAKDTVVYFDSGQTWKTSVPNGFYKVSICQGDAWDAVKLKVGCMVNDELFTEYKSVQGEFVIETKVIEVTDNRIELSTTGKVGINYIHYEKVSKP